jgi:translation initiation factor 1
MRRRQSPIYSTDPDRTQRCPRCGSHPCRCPLRRSLPPEQQTAHIRRERKGRGGKTVTVVFNLQLKLEDLQALGRHLRQECGTGGTVKDGSIEIQGDHRDKVAEVLRSLGYGFKLAGG